MSSKIQDGKSEKSGGDGASESVSEYSRPVKKSK